MLLLVAPPEWSMARKGWPTMPPGLIAPRYSRLPPRLTAVFRSKEGVWPPICALLERTQRNPVLVKAQLAPSYAWYWNPCPGPLVLSIVNHALSPPALLSGDCSVQV